MVGGLSATLLLAGIFGGETSAFTATAARTSPQIPTLLRSTATSLGMHTAGNVSRSCFVEKLSIRTPGARFPKLVVPSQGIALE